MTDNDNHSSAATGDTGRKRAIELLIKLQAIGNADVYRLASEAQQMLELPINDPAQAEQVRAAAIEECAALMRRWRDDAADFNDERCRQQANLCQNAATAISNLAAQPPAAPVELEPGFLKEKTIFPPPRSSADTTSAPEYDDKCEYYPYFEMLWKWFEERRGKEDMRANAIDGLSVADFKQMLDEHEANLIPDPPQEALKPVAYQRRAMKGNVAWSGWYIADDEPTPENMKFDGVFEYEYRPLYPGSPLPRPHGGRE